MKWFSGRSFGTIFLFLTAVIPMIAIACDQSYCSTIVNRCLAESKCNCDIKNCTCYKDCFKCLGQSFTKCCDCVNLCPKETANPSSPSYTAKFKGVAPTFDALTDEPFDEKWKVVQAFVNLYSSMNIQTNEVVSITKACRVVFVNECLSLNKCKVACKSIGSGSFRWFHDGCCECISPMCPANYFGLDTNQCENCPFKRYYNEL